MIVKLYEAPRNSLVRVVGTPTAPPDAPEVNDGEVIKFYHVDGMYSYCKNEYGDIVHIPAWQEVEVLNEVEFSNEVQA